MAGRHELVHYREQSRPDADIARRPNLTRNGPKSLFFAFVKFPIEIYFETSPTILRAVADLTSEAFQPNLTRAEADLRIAMLTAKLKPLDGPPHTL